MLTMHQDEGGRYGCLARSGPPRHLDLGPVNTCTDLRSACEVHRDPRGPAELDDSVSCSPVAAVEHVGPVVRRPHERPKDGPDGWPRADVLPPAATARGPREGAVEEPSALRHPDRLPLGRRLQTRALDEPRQVVPLPHGVGHRPEPSFRPIERRRWRIEHECANEGDRERAPHVRLRRDCTSTTCAQRDAPPWTKKSHRQPPLRSEGAMQPIVDFRLGDVHQARSSSHLIYAGSRHNPGCVRRSDGAGQQGSRVLNPAERLGRSLMSSGGPPHFLPSSESVLSSRIC